MPPPVPNHVPTAAEVDCHLITAVNQDGTCTVIDKSSGQKVTIRLGVLSVANQLTIVAVGPGSG